MGLARTTRRWTTWIAAWLILFGALAPSVSHALSAWRDVPVPFAALCTANGLQSPVAPGDSAPEGPGTARNVDPCPFCLPHGAPPLPSAAVAVEAFAAPVRYVPPLFLHAPRGLHVWSTAQPRAPPLVS